jgi:hypothetical protein
MVIVKITTPDGGSFQGQFETQEEAEAWVDKHHAMKIEGVEVEYVEEVMHNRKAKMQALRVQRDRILDGTDWLFIADGKIEPKWRKMYMTYRQYLRDLPQKIGPNKPIKIEPFKNWLRRIHPEEFMDGGKATEILKKFNSKLEK